MVEYVPALDIRKKFKASGRVRDVVRRLGVITADRVHLKRYPVENPVSIFNPGLVVDGNEVVVYSRITLGYYTYASAVAEFSIPISDLKKGGLVGHYTAEITVLPGNNFDWWGVEDPRVYEIDGMRLMTYCGRTVSYFDSKADVERALPVTAVFEEGRWRKACVFRLPKDFRRNVVSDKDAFLVKMGGKLKFFHRLHMRDDGFCMVISDVPEDVLSFDKFREIVVSGTACVIEPAKFEEKIGWGTPPVKVGGEYLLFVHAVERRRMRYSVFAILMDDNAEVTAITPYYIMQPKEIYEVYGDRPFTIFPCGAQLVDDRIIISYGAADSSIGIGEVDLSEIMAILDSNRVQ